MLRPPQFCFGLCNLLIQFFQLFIHGRIPPSGEDIRQYESYLTRNGYLIVKFFLHVSKEEQKKRFLARIDTPEKNWKFSAADIRERQYWDDYQKAYEKAINATATKENPWYVIPADDKWYSRLIVSDILTKKINTTSNRL